MWGHTTEQGIRDKIQSPQYLEVKDFGVKGEKQIFYIRSISYVYMFSEDWSAIEQIL